MTKPQIILDRLSAWVEKQSSVGPAAFKGMRDEIEREVAREPIPLEQVPQQQDGDQAEAEYRLRVVKSWLGSFPELREAITEQLAKEMGEFARDELGATASDVDEAIARDKEAQAMDQAKRLSRFCDEHGIDLELVLRSIYP